MTSAGPAAGQTAAPHPVARAAGAEPAELGRRVVAVVVDAAIGAGIVVVVGVLASIAILGTMRPSDPVAAAVASLLVALVAGIVALGWGLAYTLLQGGTGSVGQRAMGLQLADHETGAPIGFGRALVRNLVWALAGAIVVGYVSPLFDPSPYRQGWHDRAGRAVVVSRRVPRPAAPHPASDSPTTPPPPTASDRRSPDRMPPPAAPPVLGYAPPTSASPAPPAGPSGSSAPLAAYPPPPVASPPAPASPGASPSPALAPIAPATPAMPVARSGIISQVPGIGGSDAGAATTVNAPPHRAAPTPAPDPGPAATLPAPGSDGSDEPGSDGSDERGSAPGSALAPDPAADGQTLGETVVRGTAGALLVWDNGTRVGVHERTLFGRNPAREDGATAVAVRDETLSLSKTHFEMGADAQGVWVIDRHSTNGVVLVRAGRRAPLAPGERTPVRPGDRLEFGDRSATVEPPA